MEGKGTKQMETVVEDLGRKESHYMYHYHWEEGHGGGETGGGSHGTLSMIARFFNGCQN